MVSMSVVPRRVGAPTIGLVGLVGLALGCGGARGGRAAPTRPATDDLLALAPAGTRIALVASPRGLALAEAAMVRARELTADSPAALAPIDDALAEALGRPGPLDLAALGLSTAKGFAWFALADDHEVSIWPVVDRARFVAALGGERLADGDVVTVGDRLLRCREVAGSYACADDATVLPRLGTGSLVGRPAAAGGRGDIELVALATAGDGDPAGDTVVTLALEPGQVLARVRIRRALLGPLAALADAGAARALLARCTALSAEVGLVGVGDGDGCRVTATDGATFVARAWLDGDRLRVGAAGGATVGAAPTAIERELTDRRWNLVGWGRGTSLGQRLLARPATDPRQIALVRALTSLTEAGFGLQVDDDGATVVVLARTLFANPAPVADAAAALVVRSVAGDDVAADVRTLVAAHPTSPLAADVAAGHGGVLVPAVAIAAIAGLALPPSLTDIEAIAEAQGAILARTELADAAHIEHILIGWKGVGRSTSERTRAEAAALARDLAAQIAADPRRVTALMKAHSEDPGSSQSGRVYVVTADGGFVVPFRDLALRLRIGEVGVTETDFGYHVMLRVAPTPLDPLASADILARAPSTTTVHVQHVLIGWQGLPPTAGLTLDPRAAARTKAEADALAVAVLAKVRAGGDMAALMKQYSDDASSRDDGRIYPIEPGPSPVPSFTDLSLRLDLGEAGMVTTDLGWHVVKRVAPPPPPPPPPPPAPDKLDSVAILRRAPVTNHATVKHILLGWKDVNVGDPRSVGRSRAELEALVGSTVKAARRGVRFEDLMAAQSEDPGSATRGASYEVTPDAGLVRPFLELSLRLRVGEIGVVRSQFGIHIIKRVE